MESCYSPDLFSFNNSYHVSIIQGLQSFKAAYAPVHGYLCLPICAFGVVTNIIHILVLTSKNMRNSAVNVILTAIAVCDAGTMLSYFTYLIHFNFTSDYCGSLMSWWWMLFLMFHISVSIAFHTSSLWLAVTMAFIRLMTLRQGSLSSGWQLASNAWKISGVMYAIVIFLCIPTVISHQIMEHNRTHWYLTCDYNRTISDENPAGSGGHQSYLNDTAYSKYTIGISQLALADHCNLYKANLWLTGIMFKVIPCAFLVVLSCSLLARISAAEKNRQRLLGDKKVSRNNSNNTGGPIRAAQNGLSRLKSAKQGNRKRRTVDHTTIMLITILLVFLLTELPQGFIAILNAVYLRHVTNYIYQSLDDFMDLLSLVNSSLNFILYCVMSSRYRQTFWKVILPRRAYLLIFIRGTASGQTENNNHLAITSGGHTTIGKSTYLTGSTTNSGHATIGKSTYLTGSTTNSISHRSRLLVKSKEHFIAGNRHGTSINNKNSNISVALSSSSAPPKTPILTSDKRNEETQQASCPNNYLTEVITRRDHLAHQQVHLSPPPTSSSSSSSRHGQVFIQNDNSEVDNSKALISSTSDGQRGLGVGPNFGHRNTLLEPKKFQNRMLLSTTRRRDAKCLTDRRFSVVEYPSTVLSKNTRKRFSLQSSFQQQLDQLDPKESLLIHQTTTQARRANRASAPLFTTPTSNNTIPKKTSIRPKEVIAAARRRPRSWSLRGVGCLATESFNLSIRRRSQFSPGSPSPSSTTVPETLSNEFRSGVEDQRRKDFDPFLLHKKNSAIISSQRSSWAKIENGCRSTDNTTIAEYDDVLMLFEDGNDSS